MSRNPRHAILLAALLPAACVNAPLRTDSYYGRITPVGGTCDAPRPASLTIRGDKAQFAPTEGTVLLAGTIKPDGTLDAALTLTDMNHKPARYTLAAHRAGDSITGTYTTPRCRAAVSLQRQ